MYKISSQTQHRQKLQFSQRWVTQAFQIKFEFFSIFSLMKFVDLKKCILLQHQIKTVLHKARF